MKKYQVILVGVDGSKNAKEAVNKALELAKYSDAKLVLASVIKPYVSVGFGGPGLEVDSNSDDQMTNEERKHREEMLQKYAKEASQAGVTSETVVVIGSPKEELAKNLAQQYQADLIIVGATGLNRVEQVMIGSTASYVVRASKRDTLVVTSQA